jgi:hypothetical protein
MYTNGTTAALHIQEEEDDNLWEESQEEAPEDEIITSLFSMQLQKGPRKPCKPRTSGHAALSAFVR